MSFPLMMQNKNSDGRQNSYQNQKTFTRNQHIMGYKVFFKNQITLNPYFALKCIFLEFDTFQCICEWWCLFVVFPW